jgi:5'-methylthioadenosine phosphorylase
VGATHLLAVSAVGSLREEYAPGHFVIVDQFIDLTRRRETTFFNEIAGHVSLADPVCAEFAGAVAQAALTTGVTLHRGGTYVCIDGPQFSTRAESNWFRQMGAAVIGMTNATEARLAREAGLCFSTLAMVTDYDCWKEEEEHVTVESVMAVMKHNVEFARRTVVAVSDTFGSSKCSRCACAVHGAVMTDLQCVAPRVLAELDLLLPK